LLRVVSQSRAAAEQAFAHFLTTYEVKYAKAAECLAKDRDTLLTFYDFPAEHWIHIRTTNPIESTFATVRSRTAKTRGCVSRAGILGDGLQADEECGTTLAQTERSGTPGPNA
jgi:putative transposase